MAVSAGNRESGGGHGARNLLIALVVLALLFVGVCGEDEPEQARDEATTTKQAEKATTTEDRGEQDRVAREAADRSDRARELRAERRRATARSARITRARERREARAAAEEQAEREQRRETRAAAEAAAAAAAKTEEEAEPAGDCEPGYDPCVPPYPPDLDCPDLDGPYAVTGADPHGLDGDGNGEGCQ